MIINKALGLFLLVAAHFSAADEAALRGAQHGRSLGGQCKLDGGKCVQKGKNGDPAECWKCTETYGSSENIYCNKVDNNEVPNTVCVSCDDQGVCPPPPPP